MLNLHFHLQLFCWVLAEVPLLVQALLSIAHQVVVALADKPLLASIQTPCIVITSGNVLTVALLVVTHAHILGCSADISTLGVGSVVLVYSALAESFLTPGTIQSIVVKEARISLGGECVLVLCYSRTPLID